MMARMGLLSALTLSFVFALMTSPVAAQAPVPELVLGFQHESSVGKNLAVAAYLLDPAGNPVQGENVAFFIDARFMNTLGEVRIGLARTDEHGLALLVYVPKSEGEHTITARFAGNQVFAPVEASQPLQVAPGPETYTEERPFRMPGANISTVVVVLATVWGLYFLVIVLFWRISRSAIAQHGETEVQP